MDTARTTVSEEEDVEGDDGRNGVLESFATHTALHHGLSWRHALDRNSSGLSLQYLPGPRSDEDKSG